MTKTQRSVVTVQIADLIPYTNNPRVHDEAQVNLIAKSIREFGFNNPILTDGDGHVIAGHGRLMAARKLGLKEVPCIELTHLTPEQRRAYIIADNQIATKSGWDVDLLKKELDELQKAGFDLGLTGFSSKELDELLGIAPRGTTDEDDVPKPEETPRSRMDDVWILGAHRLLVGDATQLKAVETLMEKEKADLVWTDPPYNVAIEGVAGKIMNDDMSADAFRKFLTSVFANYELVMRDGAVIYVAHADSERLNFTQAYLDSGLKLSQVLVWVKQSGTLSRQDYNWQHEPILYGWKEGAAHFFCGDFTMTTVIDDDLDVDKLSKAELQDLAKELLAGVKTTAVRHDRPTKSDLHPTMKPVALVRRFIEASSKEGDLVLDLFGGSGSTMIACETANRPCRMMELDPKYADVIVKRWQEFTGKHAILESTGKEFSKVKRGSKKGK